MGAWLERHEAGQLTDALRAESYHSVEDMRRRLEARDLTRWGADVRTRNLVMEALRPPLTTRQLLGLQEQEEGADEDEAEAERRRRAPVTTLSGDVFEWRKDAAGDWKFTKTGTTAPLRPAPKPRRPPPAPEPEDAVPATADEVRAAFNELDEDSSGALDRGEVQQLVQNLMGRKVKRKELAQVMKGMDVDGDGEVRRAPPAFAHLRTRPVTLARPRARGLVTLARPRARDR